MLRIYEVWVIKSLDFPTTSTYLFPVDSDKFDHLSVPRLHFMEQVTPVTLQEVFAEQKKQIKDPMPGGGALPLE